MRRLLTISLVLLSVAPMMAGDLTPDAAYALMARSPWTRGPGPTPEEVAAARQVLDAQAKREPGSAKWVYAMAHVARLEGDLATGDAAEKKRKQALAGFEKATEMQPRIADYQFWFATASFDRVDDVNMLSKMSLASDGRKAFEKAIEIDPTYVAARVGLAQFYIGAPSIAGGSIEKAKAQGQALLAIADHRGEFQGDMLLAGIAAHEKDWAEMSKWYTKAETAQGDGAELASALRAHAFQLLNRKKDVEAAAPLVERYVKVAAADDMTALYLDGEVKRLLGHCAEALVEYDQVLAKYAQARGSRWGAAVCRDQLGQKDAARKDYEEYAKRFPDDERAKEAKAAIKRLSGS